MKLISNLPSASSKCTSALQIFRSKVTVQVNLVPTRKYQLCLGQFGTNNTQNVPDLRYEGYADVISYQMNPNDFYFCRPRNDNAGSQQLAKNNQEES